MSPKNLTIASFQGRAIYQNINKSLKTIKETMQWAENNSVDILCFPECYLQGYILNEATAREFSFELYSPEFRKILQYLQSDKTTIILGVIEQDMGNIYNTAIVIEGGTLIGKYRKQNLLNKENFFTKGSSSPVFEQKGIKYGINICSDTRFSESVTEMANSGAQILFFPINNSLPHDIAEKWKDKHVDYWIKRAQETSCWIVTADIVEESDTNTGYGFTTIIDPNGSVVESVEHLKQGRLIKYIVGL